MNHQTSSALQQEDQTSERDVPSIIEDFDAQLPNAKEDLLRLQGIGLKAASLIMNFISKSH
ncbi:hypothetical protein [Xanthomonas campestris]|uniref:hypothetical protein n=1 Tax=Xanthomonas campestris TaxID=339 RepID=UPI001CD6541F|nr:hypothetical protein [Xanthomonas campestris]